MKSEYYLMTAKTPAEYIDRCIHANDIPRGSKAIITHKWLAETGFTIEDIKRARKNHPYWKKRKLEGNSLRTMERIHTLNFSRGGGHISWNETLIKKFLKLSKHLPDGSYKTADYELARMFETSIPSIQYMRRKLNLAEKALEKFPDLDMLSLMKKSEQKIKQMLEEPNGN